MHLFDIQYILFTQLIPLDLFDLILHSNLIELGSLIYFNGTAIEFIYHHSLTFMTDSSGKFIR